MLFLRCGCEDFGSFKHAGYGRDSTGDVFCRCEVWLLLKNVRDDGENGSSFSAEIARILVCLFFVELVVGGLLQNKGEGVTRVDRIGRWD